MNGIHWTHISCADKTSCFSKLHGLFFEEGKTINPSYIEDIIYVNIIDACQGLNTLLKIT